MSVINEKYMNLITFQLVILKKTDRLCVKSIKLYAYSLFVTIVTKNDTFSYLIYIFVFHRD